VTSCVYFAEFKDSAGNVYLKVGKANNPMQRLPTLQVGCPFDLWRLRHVVLATEKLAYRAERAIQGALKSRHLRGEWFYAAANDDAGLLAIEIVPPDVAAGVAKGPVRIHSLSLVAYDRARKQYEALFGKPNVREGGPVRRKKKAAVTT